MNKKEYAIYSFFITRSLFIGGFFSFLLNLCHNDLLLCSIIGTLLGIFILYIFNKKQELPKILQILISITILFIDFLSIIVLTNTYFLTKTPTLMLLSSIVLLLIYSGTKNMETIKNYASIMFFIVLILYIIYFFGLIPVINFENILPIFTTKILDFISGICLFASVSVLPNILLLNYKNSLTFKQISIGYIIGCISIIISIFFISTIYSYEFCSTIRFPEYLILKRISISNYIQNIENILIMEWIIDVLINAFLLVQILKQKINKKLTYCLIILTALIIEHILHSNYTILIFIKNYIYFFLVILVSISLIFTKKTL